MTKAEILQAAHNEWVKDYDIPRTAVMINKYNLMLGFISSAIDNYEKEE